MRVEIIPKFGKKGLGEITRADVRRLLDDIAARAPITANRTLAVFRKLCNWAVSKDMITASPCAGIEAPTSERSRERVLLDDEVRLAWKAFDSIGWPFGLICKLLLLTGARREEVASMRWGEIDLVAKCWTLPASRTKNKRPHEIPLSDAAIEIIKRLPRIEGFVFSTTGASAVSGFSRAKTAIDRTILETPREEAEASGDDPGNVEAPEHWQVHDLRRTVATNLQRLKPKLIPARPFVSWLANRACPA